MAVLPTPGSPMSTGLFFVRRDSTCITRSVSRWRPITGSSAFSRASWVRLRPNWSRISEPDGVSPPWPPEVARLLADVRRSAERLDGLTAQPAGKSGLQAVSAQADQMLTHANSATQALEHLAQAPTARLVNMAGRQRMLSQRLAKNYFLSAAKVDSKVVQAQLASDAADFRQALQTLKAAPVSTSSIRNELELADSQWLFFESALRRPADDAGLNAVATTSERLLGVMDKLTGLYDAALREVLG